MTDPIAAQQEWKCGNEFEPYHPQASHVSPDYRDGWNACYKIAIDALRRERERAERVEAELLAHKIPPRGKSELPDMVVLLAKRDAALRADRDRLAAECERLRADAERYRWLRLGWRDPERARYGYNDAWHEVWGLQSPEALDAAIDAARKA